MNVGQGKRPTDTIAVAASMLERAGRHIEPRAVDMTAAALIAHTADIRRHVDDLEFAGVILARQEGLSWARIGDMLGLTRQAVHTRYASRLPQSLA